MIHSDDFCGFRFWDFGVVKLAKILLLNKTSFQIHGRAFMQQGVSNRIAVCVASVLAIWATPAFAYIGPGVALPAIASFLALGGVLIAAVFGLIWYPLKRLLGPTPSASENSDGAQQRPSAGGADNRVAKPGNED